MKSKLLLCACLLLSCVTTSASAATREYWISAEKVDWDYAPSGENQMHPEMGMGIWGYQTTYKKYRYLQYSDASFSQPVEQPAWMGMLGPQIRAEEGDTIKVHFYNKADKPLSIHPHGVHYDKNNEGAGMHGEPGSAVKPGEKYTNTWTADSGSAPGPSDPSSIVWAYHSHVDSVTEIYDGLIGSIVITKKGMTRSESDPRPKDVDREFTTMFMIFDENGREAVPIATTKNGMHERHHSERDMHRMAGGGEFVELSDEQKEESNLKHAINGYIFANLPGLEAKKNEKVRWYLLGMGTEVDLHTAHWHGETVLENGRRTDVVELLPTSMKTVDMIADNAAEEWMFHCHVTDHITAGMTALWKVSP